jgi:hypothetical protein
MAEQQTIDVTGLPEPVVTELQRLVSELKTAIPPSRGSATDPNRLPYDEWAKRFDEWLNRPRPPAPPFVDDSRESIYEGRGE